MRPFAYLLFAAFTAVAAAGCPTGQLTTGEESSSALLPENLQLDRSDLPVAFPQDLPLYQRSRVVESADEGNGFFVELQTTDSQSQVLSFYHLRLREMGWEIAGPQRKDDDDPQAPPRKPLDSSVVIAFKDNRLLTLVCLDEPGQTLVLHTISYAEPDPFTG